MHSTPELTYHHFAMAVVAGAEQVPYESHRGKQRLLEAALRLLGLGPRNFFIADFMGDIADEADVLPELHSSSTTAIWQHFANSALSGVGKEMAAADKRWWSNYDAEVALQPKWTSKLAVRLWAEAEEGDDPYSLLYRLAHINAADFRGVRSQLGFETDAAVLKVGDDKVNGCSA
jgi:hypothetical protein